MTFCIACLDKNGKAGYFEGLTCPVCGWKEPEWVAPLAEKMAEALFDNCPDWTCPDCGKVWTVPIGKPLCLGCPGKKKKEALVIENPRRVTTVRRAKGGK